MDLLLGDAGHQIHVPQSRVLQAGKEKPSIEGFTTTTTHVPTGGLPWQLS